VNRNDTAHGLLVAAVAFAVFTPVFSAGFVSWDDGIFILDNPWIRGFTPAHVRWMASSVLGGIWQPLSWLSLALDHSLWGLEPAGFHLTNLLLHSATAALFYFVCLRLLDGRRGAALLAALFFAVHPLRVESVAWAAERKGLLSGFFCMAAVLAHLHGRSRAAAAAFALSLMSKASSLPLPFVLVILDIYPLGLLPPDPRRWLDRPQRKVWLRLAPLFFLSAAAFVVGMLAARATGAITDPSSLGYAWTASRALYGLLFYPLKTLWPLDLSPYYPPQAWFGRASWEFAACAGLIAAIIGAAAGRSRPAITAALACYALMLLPMLGLIQHGIRYSAADRFSYLPCLGFAVLFGAALSRNRASTALAAAWLLALGVASWRQCAVWHDSMTLWSAASENAPGSIALGELGGALLRSGNTQDGISRLRETIKDRSAPSTDYVNLGVSLQKQGLEAQAREAWRLGLASAPSAELSALLGASLTKDNITAGIALLRSAVLAEPEHASWRVDLGDALARGSRNVEAKRQYAVALDLEPELGRAHNNLGLMLAREGRTAEAVAHYQAALRDPGSRAEAHHNWGNVFLANGKAADAERHYREALRINPGLALAQVNLGNILARRGAFAQAAALYRAALKTNPRAIEARANLGAIVPFLKK
jgi:tetratricopeptide (TPR) repeat protein